MQSRDIQPVVKAVIRYGAILLVSSLAACAAGQPSQKAQQIPAPAPASADPVLYYVGNGPIGRTAVVVDPSYGGNVVVVIDSQYNAASGEICRTYATTSADAQTQHLACSSGTNWQVVPPLATSNN